jgi:hypothetical protein
MTRGTSDISPSKAFQFINLLTWYQQILQFPLGLDKCKKISLALMVMTPPQHSKDTFSYTR